MSRSNLVRLDRSTRIVLLNSFGTKVCYRKLHAEDSVRGAVSHFDLGTAENLRDDAENDARFDNAEDLLFDSGSIHERFVE